MAAAAGAYDLFAAAVAGARLTIAAGSGSETHLVKFAVSSRGQALADRSLSMFASIRHVCPAAAYSH
jgi:hypothetical protein